MNRIDRLTGTILLLQSHRSLTAADIAAHWEISVRTVYRDIAALGEAGVPIVGEAGSGYRLMRGYEVPPIMFTGDEATALFVSGETTEQIADVSLKRSLRSALLKIRAVLPQERQEDLAQLKKSVAVWLRPSAASNAVDLLMPIQDAISHRYCIELKYISPTRSGITDRTVEPLGIVFYSGHWHLIAFCRLRNDYRDFRLDRIRHCDILQETFSGHADFSVHGSSGEEGIPEGLIRAILVIDAVAAGRFRAEILRGIVAEEVLDGGDVRMQIVTHSLPWLAEWLLRFGDAVCVEDPPELRELLREAATAVAARNSAGSLKNSDGY